MRAAVRSAATLVALALLVLPAAACGDDDDPEAAPGTSALGGSVTSAPSDTSVPDPDSTGDTAVDPASEEEQVLAAVQCYWDTLIAANSPPDPDHPGFGRCFTGRALEMAIATVAERLELGQTVRDSDGAFPRSVVIVDLTPDSAIVQTCVLDDGLLVDARGGEVLDEAVSTIRSELTLTLMGADDWRVERAVLIDDRPGEQPC